MCNDEPGFLCGPDEPIFVFWPTYLSDATVTNLTDRSTTCVWQRNFWTKSGISSDFKNAEFPDFMIGYLPKQRWRCIVPIYLY